MNKKPIFIAVGVLGAAAIGYVLYKRAQASPVQQPFAQSLLPTALQQTNVSPANALAQYEGRGFRDTQTGHIYLVQNGLLRDVIGWSGWDKTGWPSRSYTDLVAGGVIQQVDSTFINALPKGQNLSGVQSVAI